jgi:hypothetical protein
MNFTLNRDKTVRSLSGRSVEFKKGVSTHVPPGMWPEVLALGAQPEEELPEPKTFESREPSDPVARRATIMEAFEQMVNGAKRDSFMGTGVPHIKALTAQLGFVLDSKERDKLWQEFKEGKGGSEA